MFLACRATVYTVGRHSRTRKHQYTLSQHAIDGRGHQLSTSRFEYILALQGKFGADLLANARDEGAGKDYACTNKELLFKHGSKAQPAAGSFVSLNELTMGEHLSLCHIHLQSCLRDVFHWQQGCQAFSITEMCHR